MGFLSIGMAAALTLGSMGTDPVADGLEYGDPALWICRPDIDDDVCDSGLDATSVAADGTMTPEPFVAEPDAPVDCFYVYPTVSFDPGPNSDTDISSGEERFTVANQVAPLGTGCRVFAPVYRQVPLAGIGRAGSSAEAWTIAYGDVLDAWHHYLANDNDGRGVVLVGHSQGAGHLARLLSDEIDDDPELRALLVSAYLSGTSIQVAAGRDVGGAFDHVLLCRADEQVGCVVTWSTYRASTPPPDGAFFGRDGEGTEAGCTNPAALGGGRVELQPRLPSTPGLSIINPPARLGGAGVETGAGWLDDDTVVPNPFVTLPGLVSGGCVTWGGYHWLEISTHPDPGPRADDIPGDLTPDWGLHLVDMNVVMGDLQRLLDAQSDAWLDARSTRRPL
jgi:hypothetical protein